MKRNERIKTLIGILITIFLMMGCKKEETKPITSPLLSTMTVSEIKITSAKSGGTISSDGGAPITSKGICWSTLSQPIITDEFTNDGDGNSAFTSTITNLIPKTTYYARAYATNRIGTSYGTVVSFTTIDYPNANVSNIRVISNNSILCDFVANSDGGGDISEHGICWSTNANPTKESNHLVSLSESYSDINIPNLLNNVTYHIRGYAINEGGVGYGDEFTFTTYNWEKGTVTDIDNNSYNTIKIGNQIWMQENLKVTHFRNGDAIASITNSTTWDNLTTSAMCWYDNDESNYKNICGALYNWYTIVDSRNLCPIGWHVPSYDEWVTLSNYLGDYSMAASKMKAYSWTNRTTNESGFTALPGGLRSLNSYYGITDKACFWSSSEIKNETTNEYVGLGPIIEKFFNDLTHFQGNKTEGRSIRCIKD